MQGQQERYGGLLVVRPTVYDLGTKAGAVKVKDLANSGVLVYEYV